MPVPSSFKEMVYIGIMMVMDRGIMVDTEEGMLREGVNE